MPRLLREIVLETIRSAPDIDVARVYRDPVDLRRVVQRDHPDVVVADIDALALDQIEPALLEAPRLKLVALRDDARQLLLYELSPHRVELGEASPQRLLDVIRGCVRCGHPPSRSV